MLFDVRFIMVSFLIALHIFMNLLVRICFFCLFNNIESMFEKFFPLTTSV